MKLLFLGTGTSTGVPAIGCDCATCRSLDPCDKRLRASAILSVDGKNLLIDCGPDLRTQLLTAGSPDLDAVLITHTHYDHLGGIDDLRPYCYRFRHEHFPVYCREDVARDLRSRVPYCFSSHPYPGVPSFDMHIVSPMVPFVAAGVEVTPLTVMHFKLPILGFRVRNLAYITDCKVMPDETVEALKGVDTLVLNALRHEPHMSHLSLSEAIDLIGRISPRKAYLTHISHDMGPQALVELPDGIELAHDFMTIEIPE